MCVGCCIQLEDANHCDICCKTRTTTVFSTFSDPAFEYSYACGASLIVTYVPVLFYTYIVYGLVVPLLRFVLTQSSSYAIVQSIFRTYAYLFTDVDDVLGRVSGRDTVVMIMLHITVLMTFGIASPLLGLAIVVGILVDCNMFKLLTGSYIAINLSHVRGPHQQLIKDTKKVVQLALSSMKPAEPADGDTSAEDSPTTPTRGAWTDPSNESFESNPSVPAYRSSSIISESNIRVTEHRGSNSNAVIAPTIRKSRPQTIRLGENASRGSKVSGSIDSSSQGITEIKARGSNAIMRPIHTSSITDKSFEMPSFDSSQAESESPSTTPSIQLTDSEAVLSHSTTLSDSKPRILSIFNSKRIAKSNKSVRAAVELTPLDVFTLEQFDMMDSWRIIKGSYITLLTVIIFWSILFFDMIGDSYGPLAGSLVAVLYLVVLISIVLSVYHSHAGPVTFDISKSLSSILKEVLRIDNLSLPPVEILQEYITSIDDGMWERSTFLYRNHVKKDSHAVTEDQAALKESTISRDVILDHIDSGIHDLEGMRSSTLSLDTMDSRRRSSRQRSITSFRIGITLNPIQDAERFSGDVEMNSINK